MVKCKFCGRLLLETGDYPNAVCSKCWIEVSRELAEMGSVRVEKEKSNGSSRDRKAIGTRNSA